MSVGQAPIEDEDIGTGGYELAFTGTSQEMNAGAALVPGRYYMLATQDCWVKRGPVAGTVTAAKAVATELLLKASTYWPVQVRESDKTLRDVFAVIQDTAGGTIRFFRVSR